MSLKMDSSVIWVGQISAECHFNIIINQNWVEDKKGKFYALDILYRT